MRVELLPLNEARPLLHTMPIAFLPSLFCKEAYALSYTEGNVFVGVAHDTKQIHALIYLYEGEQRCFFSPRFLTFGGWEGSRWLTTKQWGLLLERTIRFLRQQQASCLRISLPPDFYPIHTPPQHLWYRLPLMFKEIREIEDVCHCIEVEDAPLRIRMSRGQRRYLSIPCRQGWQLRRRPATEVDWQEFYALLQLNRQTRNVPLSISFERLCRSVSIAGDALQLFELRNTQGTLLAACIALRVHPQVLYYFLPCNHPHYYVFSPMVPLLNAMYEYAQQEGISFLDLGISSVEGIINEGLSAFKERMGANRGSKKTLIINL